MLQPNRIIRLKTVLSRTGLSRSTIYRKIAEGTFPAQLKISTKGTGWHESDINRWISVPSGSRGLGDRLRSFNFCMGRSIDSHQRRWIQQSSPLPHSISVGGIFTHRNGS